ncbi:PepSY domain-containing protein [Levilactobacillus yiduensis]|uniref:PepSY domain-containing protein n=1 Tax=Levilactobacillus yiduensis TaxID=2953880 RepID=UPI000EF3211B|nr:PepSY domain-containing protein [Levilactobacillus yiduensis]AYM01745.1 lysis protein [Levilactobacillus brevis]
MRKLSWVVLASTLLLVGCTNTQQSKSSSSSSSQATSQQATSQTTTSPRQIKVTLTEAVKQFHQKFGTKVTVTELSLETENQRYQYEISGVDQTKEYELTVDARSGKTSRAQQEKLDADEANGIAQRDALPLNKVKSRAAVSKIATQEVGGGTAVAWSLDREHGTTEWEVKVTKDQTHHEVQINALTGKVVHHETDDDDD